MKSLLPAVLTCLCLASFGAPAAHAADKPAAPAQPAAPAATYDASLQGVDLATLDGKTSKKDLFAGMEKAIAKIPGVTKAKVSEKTSGKGRKAVKQVSAKIEATGPVTDRMVTEAVKTVHRDLFCTTCLKMDPKPATGK